MAKRERRSGGMPPVGGSSLLVIFSVLCLTVFALLALSTVEAGGRLSQKALTSVASYYAADVQAEEILAELRAGSIPDGVGREGDVYSYTVPIREGQGLQVKVKLSRGKLSILEWKSLPTGSWTPDLDIDVWDGVLR